MHLGQETGQGETSELGYEAGCAGRGGVRAVFEQLAEQGIQAEVIDMRCLLPLDMETLVESVERTNRVLIVEEDNLTGGWGAEVAARLGERCVYHLDAPIRRIAAPDTPAPTALPLEQEYLPDAEKITAAARILMDGG